MGHIVLNIWLNLAVFTVPKKVSLKLHSVEYIAQLGQLLVKEMCLNCL